MVNEESFIAGRPGVFGGGDAVSGPNTVVEAIADGKGAAVMIDRYLTGRQMKLIPRVALPTVYVEPLHTGEEDQGAAGRLLPPLLDPAARRKNYKEVDLRVPERLAVCEARRCLRCDIEFTQPA